MKPLALFFLIAAVYLACFLWLNNYGAFWSEDAGVKYLQVVNLVRSYWTDAAIEYPGRRIDPGLEFNPLRGTHTFVREGRIYSIYPLAFPFLSSLLFTRLGFPGLYLIPMLSTLVMIALVYATGRRISGKDGAALMALAAAFACPIFFYAFAFWEMNVAASLLMAGLYLAMCRKDAPPPRDAVVAGVVMGAAVLFREESLLFILSLAIVMIAYRRDLRVGGGLLLGAGLAGAVGVAADRLAGGAGMAHLFHNIAVRTREFGSTTEFIRYKWSLIRELLLDGYPGWGMNLALLAPWGAYLIALVMMKRGEREPSERTDAGRERVVLTTLSLILASHCAYLWGNATGNYPVRLTLATSGLLMFSPWAAFAMSAPRRSQFNHAGGLLLRELALVSTLCLALICAFVPTSGGLQWGPRYLVIIYPLLAIVSCASFSAWRERSMHRTWLTALFTVFMLLAAGNEFRGVGLLKWKKEFNARVMARLRQSRAETVIALPWWVPLSMAPAFYEKEFFSARDPSELDRLIALLRKSGRKGFILITENDPAIVDLVAERHRIAPAKAQQVQMRGDDFFRLILMECRIE